ncbi:MAG: cyclic nucleotide-binding domain-containing protein [Sideroxydans sp.]|nr:cyclic nucleotide-binding domain-containing protein [Sideroxydans sp.]
MTHIQNILGKSMLLEELSASEIEIVRSLLSTRHVDCGDVITQPRDEHAGNLFILVRGRIEVRIESEEGINTLIVVNPGDLAGIITFSGRSISPIKVTAVALEATQVLSMERARFESLIYTHPQLMYRFYQGMVRHTHRMMRHFNAALIDLKRQISPSEGVR